MSDLCQILLYSTPNCEIIDLGENTVEIDGLKKKGCF